MIVDPTRFEGNRKSWNTEKIITYCGKLDGDKDGDEMPRQTIESQIRRLGIENRVIITGAVQRNKMPELLCNSDILAQARPNNKQAEGGSLQN